METQTLEQEVAFNFPLEILKQTEEAGEFHIVGYAATTDFDLQGDVITEEALKGSSLDLLKNSTVLLNHDIKQAIGKVTKAEFDKNGLLIDVLISKTEPEIIQKIKEGVLNKFSIRGQVIEREKKFLPELDRVVNVIKRMSLVEVSLVSVPANPEARAIGWYISKALQESDGPDVTDRSPNPQGGSSMSKDKTIKKEISKEDEPTPGPETPPAKPDPEPAPTDTKTPEPAPSAKATEEPEPVAKSKLPEKEPSEVAKQNGMMAHMEFAWSLLDKLISMGGEAAATALLVKNTLKRVAGDTSHPLPAMPSAPTPKGMSKEEMGEIVAAEVKKQLEPILSSLPVFRKGLVQNEHETQDVKKQFEGLTPDRKLKVALALQQS